MGMLMAALRRVVLDTNVLVAAAYNPRSGSRHVVEACLDGGLTAVVSPALRLEYEFEPAQTLRVVPDDPEDDKLVAAARAARAVLVTNDAHLLALAGFEGLEVMRPADVRAH
jgi:predicted nucleic acid-binding protein